MPLDLDLVRTMQFSGGSPIRRVRFVQEAHAAGEICVRHIEGRLNAADVLTKHLPRPTARGHIDYLLNRAEE